MMIKRNDRMSGFKFFIAIGAVAALSACSKLPLTDKDLPKPVDLAAEWQAVLAGNPAGHTGVRDGWLEGMNMPALNLFVGEVLKNSPGYLANAQRMRAAEYNIRVAGSDLLPRLSASFRGSRQHVSNPSVTANNHTLGLDASWEIDVWGRLSDNKALAVSDYASTRHDLEAARLSLVAQVAQGWFRTLEAYQQVELAERTVKSFERSTAIIRNRYTHGLTNGLDLRLSLTNLEAAKASLSQRTDEFGALRRNLEILAGRYPANTIEIATGMPVDLPDVPAGIPADILERRPDLRAAKARLLSAGYRTQVADKALLPSFSLTVSGSNSSKNFGDLLKFDSLFWNLIGNITQPLFQGGRLRYGAKVQQANFEAEKQVFAQTLLRAFKEVEDALSSDRALREQLIHRQKAAENAIAAEKVALDQYSRGLIKISTLLDSQRQSLTQQGQFLTVKRQRINNRISLHLALGGDFTTLQDKI